MLHLDTSCFKDNQVYSFNPKHECIKLKTPQECQLACKQTSGCSKFSYFTKYFKGSNDVESDASRGPLDCCLLTNTDATDTLTKKQHAVSGPKFCISENTTLSNNNVRDIFSGKTIKCTIKCQNVLPRPFLFSATENQFRYLSSI